MKKIIFTILLVLLVVEYSSTKRMIEKSYASMEDYLMLETSCPKGSRWVNGFIDQNSNGTTSWNNGACKKNSDNCKQFVASTGNCAECKYFFKLVKNQSSGHYCEYKWWVIMVAVIVGVITLFIFCCLS